jgi:hypothetical protein
LRFAFAVWVASDSSHGVTGNADDILYENYTNIVEFRALEATRVNSGRTSGADKTENVLESIRELRHQRPKSLMGQIRWMLPDIEAALDSGHSLTDVYAMLNKHGVAISYKQLSLYIGRIRREEEKRPRRGRIAERSAPPPDRGLNPLTSNEDSLTTSSTSADETVPLLKTDPLANLKQRKPTIPTFSGTANKEDLY